MREKALAHDLARGVALHTFSGEASYDEDAIWFDKKPSAMNERPCDHEENGTQGVAH